MVASSLALRRTAHAEYSPAAAIPLHQPVPITATVRVLPIVNDAEENDWQPSAEFMQKTQLAFERMLQEGYARSVNGKLEYADEKFIWHNSVG